MSLSCSSTPKDPTGHFSYCRLLFFNVYYSTSFGKYLAARYAKYQKLGLIVQVINSLRRKYCKVALQLPQNGQVTFCGKKNISVPEVHRLKEQL
jgi:hypothetical protein